MTTKVTLREKSISKGRKSLYLDFYPPITNPKTNTLTRRKFLKMYVLVKPKTQLEKQNDKETKQIAEQIRHRRENELNKPEIYTEQEKENLKITELGKQNFVEYFKKLAQRRSSSNYDNWISSLHYLNEFTNGTLLFSNLNEAFCNDFKDFLLNANSKRHKYEKTKIATNTACSYFNKFKASLKQSYKDGYLKTDLNAKIETIKQEETHRECLTIEELNRLIQTDCTNETLKKAALFSSLTGLRFSDIEKMVWKEIEEIEKDTYIIKFKQKKTKGSEVLPIGIDAYNLLGKRTEPQKKVFENLVYSSTTNEHLAKWIEKAKITKKITFHSFRHTFATLQLTNGTDITTVSKMLGHKDLKTTLIYAKTVDSVKRIAAENIKLNF